MITVKRDRVAALDFVHLWHGVRAFGVCHSRILPRYPSRTLGLWISNCTTTLPFCDCQFGSDCNMYCCARGQKMSMENQWEPDMERNLGILYEGREDDRVPFECIREYLCYPAKFRHGERTLIADLPKKSSNGRAVRLFESRCAARFFTVAVQPDADRPSVIYESGSGSEMAHLAAEVAQAYHENLPLTENDLSRRMAMAAADGMFVPEPWRRDYPVCC